MDRRKVRYTERKIRDPPCSSSSISWKEGSMKIYLFEAGSKRSRKTGAKTCDEEIYEG